METALETLEVSRFQVPKPRGGIECCCEGRMGIWRSAAGWLESARRGSMKRVRGVESIMSVVSIVHPKSSRGSVNCLSRKGGGIEAIEKR